MKSTQPRSWKTRAAAVGLGLALVGGMSLVAAPAQAVAATHSISGVLLTEDTTGDVTDFSGLYVNVNGDLAATTAADGSYTLTGLADGSYNLEFSAPEPGMFENQAMTVEVLGGDVTLDQVTLAATPPQELPALPAGTAVITGTATVGSVLGVTLSGWPDGTQFTYQWGFSTGQSGGPVEGATGSTYTVTAADAGRTMAVIVTGTLAGYTATDLSAFMASAVPGPAKPGAVTPGVTPVVTPVVVPNGASDSGALADTSGGEPTLAATGSDVAGPMTAAMILLLLGGALSLVRLRRVHAG